MREEIITYELIKKGVKPHLQGFKFLVNAVDIYIDYYKNPLPIIQIYEMVSEDYGVNYTNVERNIRNARLNAKKEFKKMSNAEFISRVAIDLIFKKEA